MIYTQSPAYRPSSHILFAPHSFLAIFHSHFLRSWGRRKRYTVVLPITQVPGMTLKGCEQVDGVQRGRSSGVYFSDAPSVSTGWMSLVISRGSGSHCSGSVVSILVLRACLTTRSELRWLSGWEIKMTARRSPATPHLLRVCVCFSCGISSAGCIFANRLPPRSSAKSHGRYRVRMSDRLRG